MTFAVFSFAALGVLFGVFLALFAHEFPVGFAFGFFSAFGGAVFGCGVWRGECGAACCAGVGGCFFVGAFALLAPLVFCCLAAFLCAVCRERVVGRECFAASCTLFLGGGGVVRFRSGILGPISAFWCAVFGVGLLRCEFGATLFTCLRFVVRHVALLDRSPVHVEGSLPVEDAARSGDDVCEVCCAVGALHCYVFRSPGH